MVILSTKIYTYLLPTYVLGTYMYPVGTIRSGPLGNPTSGVGARSTVGPVPVPRVPFVETPRMERKVEYLNLTAVDGSLNSA